MNHTDRFWSKVAVAGPDDCWPWTKGVATGGYGNFSMDGHDYPAHRMAWALSRGPIPKGEGRHDFCVCHRCDVPRCCNPNHLFLASQVENIRDRDRKGRQKTLKGTENPNAKLQESQVREILLQRDLAASVLARRYSVDSALIYRIWAGKIWKHVTVEAIA